MPPAMHRLERAHLQLDQPLPWNVFDAAGNLLLRKGFVINRDTQIEALIERGMFVNAAEFHESQRAKVAAVYDPLSLWELVQARLAYILEALPHDGSLSGEVSGLASHVCTLAERSPNLVLAAIMLMDQRNYPIAHSLHAAIIADLVARRAQWPAAERHRLACAGLTMNVAMIALQIALCNQREPLSAEQRRQINEHPANSAKILIQCGIDDDEWLRAVLEHHETPDGMGYPRKVSNPSDMALLLHTADVFTAKVSPRAHRRPMIASEATRVVFTLLGQQGKNPFPSLLVKEIGIYPPGSIVKLVNGEIGVVRERGASAKTPLVAVLLNASGMPTLQPVMRTVGSEPGLAVASALARDRALVGLNFNQIWPK